MMSPSARKDFLEGAGFCRKHFWQAKAIEQECWADGFGVAILCENLLDAALNDLVKIWANKAGLKAGLFKLRRPSGRQGGQVQLIPGSGCIACKAAMNSEEHYLSTLQELLGDSDFAERWRESAGLCLVHIRAAAGQWTSDAAMELIRRTTEKRVRQLLNELREFQRKHDYQYKNEPRGEECSSPERTIEFLVGPGDRPGGKQRSEPSPNTPSGIRRQSAR
jgi:uncharacterized protein DUF6062